MERVSLELVPICGGIRAVISEAIDENLQRAAVAEIFHKSSSEFWAMRVGIRNEGLEDKGEDELEVADL